MTNRNYQETIFMWSSISQSWESQYFIRKVFKMVLQSPSPVKTNNSYADFAEVIKRMTFTHPISVIRKNMYNDQDEKSYYSAWKEVLN